MAGTTRAAAAATTEIKILKVAQAEFSISVLGTSPLIINRVAEKARHELLLPSGRKTAADKAASLKHDPVEEFRASPYRLREENAPTLLALPAETFKAAMGTAALDLPGAKKAQIGRLVYVVGRMIPIYGEPQLLMSVVRNSDMNHTPDIRTRLIVPEWCADLTISFVLPTIRQTAVANLLGAAGITAGVGDWRPEKGKGSYGQFIPVGQKDPRVAQLRKLWGRDAQIRAMEDPQPFDLETEELLEWFKEEAPKRGFERDLGDGDDVDEAAG